MPPSRGWIFWDKLISEELSFSSGELAWTSYDRALKRVKILGTGNNDSSKSGRHKGKVHNTQKPIPLYKWLLTNYAKEGDLILDTHVGSASSLIACEDKGFDYAGCEIDENYFEAASTRIAEFRSQPKLFPPKYRQETGEQLKIS